MSYSELLFQDLAIRAQDPCRLSVRIDGEKRLEILTKNLTNTKKCS